MRGNHDALIIEGPDPLDRSPRQSTIYLSGRRLKAWRGVAEEHGLTLAEALNQALKWYLANPNRVTARDETEPYSLRAGDEVLKRLSALADAKHMTLSDLVDDALELALKPRR